MAQLASERPTTVKEVLDALPPADRAEFLQWAEERAKADSNLGMLRELRLQRQQQVAQLDAAAAQRYAAARAATADRVSTFDRAPGVGRCSSKARRRARLPRRKARFPAFCSSRALEARSGFKHSWTRAAARATSPTLRPTASASLRLTLTAR